MMKVISRLVVRANRRPQSNMMWIGELQALRQLLLLTQGEAAQLIGNVSERSWQYWESGRRPVPEDVAVLMRSIASDRAQLLDAAITQLRARPDNASGLAVWYQDATDWRWRERPGEALWARNVHNSVLAELLGRGLVTLVKFDPKDFSAWVKNNGRAIVRIQDEAQEHLAWAEAKAAAREQLQ